MSIQLLNLNNIYTMHTMFFFIKPLLPLFSLSSFDLIKSFVKGFYNTPSRNIKVGTSSHFYNDLNCSPKNSAYLQ